MYQAPSVKPPTVEDVKEISQSLGLGIPEDELGDYKDVMKGMFENSYAIMERYTEPTLPVKYPRTPGYRPMPEDNKHNAWYVKTNIPGASDGPLKGYKVVIKDNFPVAGVPCMNGSRVMQGYVPDFDPTLVTRILDAGATIVGKAVCEDMCFGGCSFSSHPAPVLNPVDPTRTSGGSSSGCAVLVQTGEADLALGGDQGGSIRIPSSWTGIVGHKPTFGLVPYTGLGSLTTAIDTAGPMARTVKDCALMLQVLAGNDGGLDARQVNTPEAANIPRYVESLTGDAKGLKIGLLTEGFDLCETDVADLVRSAAEKLKTKGATVENVSIPIHKDGSHIFLPTCAEGSYHSMFHAQGFSVGPPGYYPTSAIENIHAAVTARKQDCAPTLKLVQLLGKYILDRYGVRNYAKSQNLLRFAREKYDEKLAEYDVLVMPTLPYKAPKLPGKDATTAELLHSALGMITNTSIFNGTGHPALSLPAGLSEGLPVGMMIVGKHMDDAKVLNVAYAYEQLLK